VKTVYLALGSNLGDRLAHLRQARELLSELAEGPITSAPLYQTDPLDCPPHSPAYLNTVVSLRCALSPQELLEKTQAIEAKLGREAQETRALNAPRPIDIDLLLHGEEVLSSPELTLPHPRMHERRFVLTPLREIAPTLIPPTHANPVSILLELITSNELPPLLYADDW